MERSLYCLPFCIEKKIKRTSGMCAPIDGTYEMSRELTGASVCYENVKHGQKCVFTFHLTISVEYRKSITCCLFSSLLFLRVKCECVEILRFRFTAKGGNNSRLIYKHRTDAGRCKFKWNLKTKLVSAMATPSSISNESFISENTNVTETKQYCHTLDVVVVCNSVYGYFVIRIGYLFSHAVY